MTPNHSIPIY